MIGYSNGHHDGAISNKEFLEGIGFLMLVFTIGPYILYPLLLVERTFKIKKLEWLTFEAEHPMFHLLMFGIFILHGGILMGAVFPEASFLSVVGMALIAAGTLSIIAA